MLVFAGITMSILAFQPVGEGPAETARGERMAVVAARALNTYHQAATAFAIDTESLNRTITLGELFAGGYLPGIVTEDIGSLSELQAERPFLALWQADVTGDAYIVTRLADTLPAAVTLADRVGGDGVADTIQPYNVRFAAIGLELSRQSGNVLGAGVRDGRAIDSSGSGELRRDANDPVSNSAQLWTAISRAPEGSPLRAARLRFTEIDSASNPWRSDTGQSQPHLEAGIPPVPACLSRPTDPTLSFADCCVDFRSAPRKADPPTAVDLNGDGCVRRVEWRDYWRSELSERGLL